MKKQGFQNSFSVCLRHGTGVGGWTAWELLPSAPTPGLAQARSCLSFPEALTQQGPLSAHAQGSFSQGPGHARKAPCTCPAGCQGEARAQPSSGAPTHMLTLSLCACSRHYAQNSSPQQQGGSQQKNQGRQRYRCPHGLGSGPGPASP